MAALQISLNVLSILLGLYLIVLWARFIVDLVMMFARQWRPRGLGLVIVELVYTLTDPPLRLARRLVPPLRLGPTAVDFSPVAVMLALVLVMTVVSWASAAARI